MHEIEMSARNEQKKETNGTVYSIYDGNTLIRKKHGTEDTHLPIIGISRCFKGYQGIA